MEPLLSILDQGRIPVMASIGLGYDGEAYNINADTVAAEIAVALNATKLIILTDVDGVHGSDGNLLGELDRTRAATLIDEGVIGGGHDPQGSRRAPCPRRTEAAHIIDGRVPHALLLELLTAEGVGTMFAAAEATQ